MPKVIILGSSNAIPDEHHENTHMVVLGKERTVMIDCVSNPIIRLQKAGVTVEGLTDLILTHFHPDHVSGVPLLLMDLWLMGRKNPLNIYGLADTLDRMEAMLDLYNWKSWPGFFPVHFHRVPEQAMFPVIAADELQVWSSPVKHLIPTIGVRLEFPQVKKVFTYSCDTEPTPAVIELAAGADLLIHETAGASKGHSSPRQAGEIAQAAGAAALFLIHYPTANDIEASLIEDAKQSFSGPVGLAKDWMEFDFD